MWPKHGGKPHGPDLKAAPFRFGIVAPTRDNGTSFPIRNFYEGVCEYDMQMDNDFNLYEPI